ncbi:MAG: PilW family protein [Opitutaceae bacterium]
MTISNRKSALSNNSVHRLGGFTLVEVMVAVTILSFVMASILSMGIFFSKNAASLGNYSVMSRSSRSGLEHLARDLHSADKILEATSAKLTLELPADLGGAEVSYVYDNATETVSRTVTDGAVITNDVLLSDVNEFAFYYYNRLGNPLGTNLTSAKSVQVDAKLLKKVITTDTTDYIISARFLMRNI